MEMTMTNPEMTYYTNGQIKTITYRNDNGQVEYEEYYIDNNLTGPAVIQYDDNGNVDGKKD